jgi:hypothetical protein
MLPPSLWSRCVVVHEADFLGGFAEDDFTAGPLVYRGLLEPRHLH